MGPAQLQPSLNRLQAVAKRIDLGLVKALVKDHAEQAGRALGVAGPSFVTG